MSSCCVQPSPRITQNVHEPVQPLRDFVVMNGFVDLQPTSNNQWTDAPLEVTLPEPGTYHIDAIIRSAMSGSSPVNIWIGARLFDVTNNNAVPNSEIITQQISLNVSPSGTVVHSSGNSSGPISVQYTVTGATLIRVQARRVNSTGSSNNARVLSGGSGRSTLRYERVST